MDIFCEHITTYVVVFKIDIQTETTWSDVGDRVSDMIRCSVSRSRFWGKRRHRSNAESTFFRVNGRRVLWYLRYFLPARITTLLLSSFTHTHTTMSLRIGSQRIGAALRAQRTSASQTVRRSYASTATSNLPEAKRQEIQVGEGRR